MFLAAFNKTYLCVLLGRLKHLSEVLVSFLVLVTCLTPLCHGLTVEDEDVEEGIEKKNGLVLDAGGVEQDRLTALVLEAVAVKSGLNHDQTV
jgi:hypothetical protein